jgi:hypothetical protein
MAYGKFDLDPDVLRPFPAQELIFVSSSFPTVQKRTWIEKWTSVGGRLFEGRPIALKNDPIWRKISYRHEGDAPYDEAGAIDARDIGRREAQALGLITADQDLDLAAFHSDSPNSLTVPAHPRTSDHLQ